MTAEAADREEAQGSADPEARRDAVRRMAEQLRERPTGPEADRLVGRLARAAADPQWSVRHALASALSRVLDPRLDPAVVQLCRDDHGQVRKVAAEALKLRGRGRRDQRREEQELEALSARLAQLGRRSPAVAREARDLAYDLVATIAARARHDMLSPIGKVRAALARPPAAPADWQRWRDEVARHLETIERIVQGVRDVGGDRPDVELEVVSVRRLAEEALGDASPAHSLELEMRVEVAAGLEVEAPAAELRRALQNVIQNAFDALEAKGRGRVVVRAERLSGDRAAIHVEDDGCGIGPEAVSLVRIPGYTTKGGDRGYGLSNVAALVERVLGGTVAIESAVGRGTTVSLCFPARSRFEEAS